MIKPSRNILTIHSRKSELKKAEDFLQEFFNNNNVPQNNFNKVWLCISEAIINSIVHGHKNDEDKEIRLQVKLDKQHISVTITDEGEGFNFYEVADPTEKENLKKESGRGIHIIKSMCEALEYNKKGNSIQFLINCK